MSTDVYAVPARLRAYGQTTGAAGASIASAGALDLGAHIAALTPVLGAIGTEFLGVFGVAQATHAASIAELAGHFHATAAAAQRAAANYEHTDNATAAAALAIQGAL